MQTLRSPAYGLQLIALSVAVALAPTSLAAQDAEAPSDWVAPPSEGPIQWGADEAEAPPTEAPTPRRDVWLLADSYPLTHYSLEGELLGEIGVGAWFRPLLEEEGWVLVHLEADLHTLFWILREQVTEIDFGEPELSDQAHAEEASAEPEATSEPAVPLIPTSTSTPAPTVTSAPTPVPTPVPTADAPATATATATAAPTPSATATSVPTATATVPPTAAPASAAVSMRDNSFAPSSVTVRVGGTVTWTNVGQLPHTATRSSSPQSFDSGIKTTGQVFSFTFTAAGTVSYLCTVHGPAMSGQVVVQ